MKQQVFFKPALYCSLMVLVMLSAQVWSQPPTSRRGGLYGDWDIKVQFGEREMNSILSFSRNAEGQRTGQLISFMGVTDLKDVQFEENKLSFVQTVRSGENEFTSSFTGMVEDGKLTGTLSSDRGDSKVEGKPSPRIPRAVGTWQMKVKMEDRERQSTMAIKVDKEGKLSGQWSSDRGTPLQIPEVQYERGNLSFTMEGKREDREWKMSFKGTIDRETDTLTGTFTSNRGEMPAEGKLIGAAAIGTWNLESTSERGTRKQRLVVNPDMSGLYGTLPIEKVNLEDGRVSFKMVMEFGDQKFEMSFQGKIEDTKLTGEMTTSRGTQKITGTKAVRTFRRRSTT